MTALGPARVWTFVKGSFVSTSPVTLTTRDSATGSWAVDFSNRLPNNTIVVSGTATNASLTIGTPTASNDGRSLEFAITAGLVAGTTFEIEVTATDNGTPATVDSVLVTLVVDAAPV